MQVGSCALQQLVLKRAEKDYVHIHSYSFVELLIAWWFMYMFSLHLCDDQEWVRKSMQQLHNVVILWLMCLNYVQHRDKLVVT